MQKQDNTLIIIGRNFKRIREEKNVSLEELSNKLCVSIDYLKQIENGTTDEETSDISFILKISRTLHVDFNKFFIE